MSDPFNLPKLPKQETKAIESPLAKVDRDFSAEVVSALPDVTRSSLTQDQRDSLGAYVKNMRFGISSVAPMICRDDKCPYFNKCGLVRANIPRPIGKDCPQEDALQKVWIDQFAKDLGIDVDDPSTSVYDMLLLNDLANYQLLEVRATMELSENPKIQTKSIVAIDPKTGNPIYRPELNQIILFKEKIAKMKNKLLRELIATRKAKSEDAKGMFADRSQQAAELLRRAKELREAKVVDAKVTTQPK